MSSLIINNKREEILRAVNDNQVIIISSSTGSGKSTLVPMFLHENGYDVIVSEPRRVAAITLASRVKGESTYSSDVGYHTMIDSNYSSKTRILYSTGAITHCKRYIESHNAILVIDEVHEWQLNTEVLLSWAKQELVHGRLSKLVIMSATIDNDIDAYFDGLRVTTLRYEHEQYPIVNLQIRKYDMNDIWKIAMEYDYENILIFLPGKIEIEHAVIELRTHKPNSVILPLYSNMSVHDQHKVFNKYNKQKIVVATNIAQTSITIPELDVVIDSGLEKYPSYKYGAKSLTINNISQFDIIQRRGRVGRTKQGIYILASSIREDDRVLKPIPHIYKTPLDTAVLELMYLGVTSFDDHFFHKVNQDDISPVKSYLVGIGALDSNLRLTSLGNRLANIPFSIPISLPIVLAEDYECSDDVTIIQAILSFDGKFVSDNIPLNDHRLLTNNEIVSCNNSDLLALLKIFRKCMRGGIKKPSKLINWVAYEYIESLYASLKTSIKHYVKYKQTSSNPKDIIKCCLSWMIDNIFTYNRVSGKYTHLLSYDEDITLNNTSICVQDDEYLIGMYQIFSLTTDKPTKIVCNSTVVSGYELVNLFPYAVSYGEPRKAKRLKGHVEIPVKVRGIWCTSNYERDTTDIPLTRKEKRRIRDKEVMSNV